jgi:hypothetical protein
VYVYEASKKLLAETGHNGSSLSDKITQRSKKEIAG